MLLQEILDKLKDTNDLKEPGEIVQLIEEVGMLIDDLDLGIIEIEEKSNLEWAKLKMENPEATIAVITNSHKISNVYKDFRQKTVLLKRLRRHYRLLQTKLNLITKPRGR